MRYKVHRSSASRNHAITMRFAKRGTKRIVAREATQRVVRAGHPWKAVHFFEGGRLRKQRRITHCADPEKRLWNSFHNDDMPIQRRATPSSNRLANGQAHKGPLWRFFIPRRGSNRPREMPARSRANRQAKPSQVEPSRAESHRDYDFKERVTHMRVIYYRIKVGTRARETRALMTDIRCSYHGIL